MTTHIPTERLRPVDVPTDDAGLQSLILFAHTFDGYKHWGSVERCAEIANGTSNTLEALRTRLFFEARRWRHSGEDPDAESLACWRNLVAELRSRVLCRENADSAWLSDAICRLPSDPPVPSGTSGYNRYTTQRDHWMGWLNPAAGTGTYPRRTGHGATARLIYNRIVEPQMLLWLAEASGVEDDLVSGARDAAASTARFGSKAAAIRKFLPWSVVADALTTRPEASAA